MKNNEANVNTSNGKSAARRTGMNTKTLALLGIFTALIILLAFTPMIGYINLGVTRATIIHIPVILASLMLGPKYGGILGFVFGLTSFINNTFNPTPTSFVFTPFYSLAGIDGGFASLIICFVPRILVGVVPHYIYRLFMKIRKQASQTNVFALALSGVAGSLTNTLLVMNMIFLFFGNEYAKAREITGSVYKVIVSVIVVNGIPEAILAGVLIVLLGKVFLNKRIRSSLNV